MKINSKHLFGKELSSGELKKSFAEKSKEYSDLDEIIEDAKNIFLIRKKMSLEKIINEKVDDEIKKMAEKN